MKMKLTNTKKREEFLDTFDRWPIWWEVPEVKLTVRRFDLPGGHAVIAAQYANDYFGGSRPHWQFIRPGGYFGSNYACSANVIIGHLLALGHIEVEVPDADL